MSKKLAFSWILHQYQPVGTAATILSETYHACYRPLLDTLERHPALHVALHYSGTLLDWLIVAHPDYIARVAALVQRGQVEMLTSGYYEPILPSIPEFDQYGQIMKMNAAIRQHFGVEPAGLWLTEQVWEPSLPSVLARAGVRYTILDDAHFTMAGLPPQELCGYYITEDQGHPLTLLPNSRALHAIIPARSIAAAEAELRRLAVDAGGESCLVVLIADGENSGAYDHIWRDGYSEQFLAMLANNADWLETVTPLEYLRREEPCGRVYIPAAARAEVMEWALPTERQIAFADLRDALESAQDYMLLSFLRGGIWRNFAAKYPEANNFHKKMLRVQAKVRNAAMLLGPHKTQEALDQVWQGQCNSAYWHGVVGGLYSPTLRSALYEHLIGAEAITDSALPLSDPTVTLTDFDCDGHDEILIEGPQMDVYISPRDGGSIFEWDWKVVPFNFVDTLARRPEAYQQQHQAADSAAASSGVAAMVVPEQALHYDTTRRTVLRERFFGAATTWSDLATMRYKELSDFHDGAFEHRIEGVGVDALVVDLWRDGVVRDGRSRASLRLRKVITVAADVAELRVNYTLYNTSTRQIRARFGIEGNWGMLGGENPDAWYAIDGARPPDRAALDTSAVATGIREVALINSRADITLTLTPGTPADLWRFPIETVGSAAAGFPRSYQCSCTLLHWPIDIAPGDRWSVTLRMAPGKLAR